MTSNVSLRDIIESDLPILFEQQLDSQATALAAFSFSIEATMNSTQDDKENNKEAKTFWTRANAEYLARWAVVCLISTIAWLLVSGCLLELIVDGIANRDNSNTGHIAGASLIFLVALFIIFSGYPLVGAIAGVLIGIVRLKYDFPKREPNIIIYGIITGLVVATFGYILIYIVATFA